MPIVRLIRGCPGSGKSTFAKTFPSYHLEADMAVTKDNQYQWKPETVKQSHQFTKELVERIMEFGADVTISNTFTMKKEIQPYLDLAAEYCYKVEIYRCTGQFGNVHSVPVEALEKMKNRFESIEGEIIL